jgi:hypothetical protein
MQDTKTTASGFWIDLFVIIFIVWIAFAPSKHVESRTAHHRSRSWHLSGLLTDASRGSSLRNYYRIVAPREPE